ncbi:MAG: glutamine synthetase III [Planctomycetes bacterium]|nr:glutamine synthetase III [Planctomycetota bacterium]
MTSTMNPRHAAVRAISSDSSLAAPRERSASRARLPELFGSLVFNDHAQRARLPKAVYSALRRTIDAGEALDPRIADAVANAMKDWAIEHGATHFTHWFQPMTGLTAQKHDSFLQQTSDGRAILEFSGRELIKGEPDASSFPSGGIRVTFEARGYTAWDPTSPAFLRRSAHGATLCIPTAFASWTGEALDMKTPLLRSCEAISKVAVRLLHLLGERDVEKVHVTCGPEQEYFLIERQFFALRPDLVATGRTLFGAKPPKGQELEDHYFGAISQRVLAFMMDLENELWQLGIPIKTRHNEVAPSQFELAPIFEQVTVAADHNMLTMEVLKDVAERHGLTCLLAEKPFAGVNGSGKHNNYSLADDQGNNLLEPGNTPHDNLKFMVFLSAIVRAVDLHQDLLRASVATAGNDHRLGANEAPPAIVSIFVGAQLEDVILSLVEGRAPKSSASGKELRLGVNTLPPLPRDQSDRNRTSPFAFTGNKFEFRAVGSSQSIAWPNTILNTIVAESVDWMAAEIERRGGAGDRREVIQALVREVFTKHKRILFSGDNYSQEWVQEAERRGLQNLRDTPSALAKLDSPANAELFARFEVFSARELQARSNVVNQAYSHRISVEALSMRDIAQTLVLPAAFQAQRRVADSIQSVLAVNPQADVRGQKEHLAQITDALNRLRSALGDLVKSRHQAEEHKGGVSDVARAFREDAVPAMARVREAADTLEALVDDDLWPLPKYRELLFLH